MASVSGSRSVDKFVLAATTIGPRIAAELRKGVNEAALTVTLSTRAEIATATKGSNRLSGVGLRGAKVGAGFDVKGTQNPTALIRARGPLHLIERDTKAHVVAPRRKQALFGAGFDHPVSHPIRTPGTKGKHPFEKGVDRAIPVAEAIVHRAVLNAYTQAFRP